MATDIQRIRDAYQAALDGPAVDFEQFRERAPWHVADLLRHVDELEATLARLREEKRPAAAPPDDYDEPDSCQCATNPHPPCSWCENGGGTDAH